MKSVLFCLLAAAAFTGCEKREAAESEAAPTPVPTTNRAQTTAAAKATVIPVANDWMWKKANGKDRNVDPLKRKATPTPNAKKPALVLPDDPLERKSK